MTGALSTHIRLPWCAGKHNSELSLYSNKNGIKIENWLNLPQYHLVSL